MVVQVSVDVISRVNAARIPNSYFRSVRDASGDQLWEVAAPCVYSIPSGIFSLLIVKVPGAMGYVSSYMEPWYWCCGPLTGHLGIIVLTVLVC